MPQGTVKWFNDAKGYGFIGQKDGEDVFVHYSSILMPGFKRLIEGAVVEFDIDMDSKGLRATNVSVIEQPETGSSIVPDEESRGSTGIVTEWVTDKGYGFIELDDDGDNVFLHINDLFERPDSDEDDVDLRDQRVAFDTVPEPGKKKARAINVVLLAQQSEPSLHSKNGSRPFWRSCY